MTPEQLAELVAIKRRNIERALAAWKDTIGSVGALSDVAARTHDPDAHARARNAHVKAEGLWARYELAWAEYRSAKFDADRAAGKARAQ